MGGCDYQHKTKYYREKSPEEVHGDSPGTWMILTSLGVLIGYCIPWGIVYVAVMDHSIWQFIRTVFENDVLPERHGVGSDLLDHVPPAGRQHFERHVHREDG